MSKSHYTMNCPNCGAPIDLGDMLETRNIIQYCPNCNTQIPAKFIKKEAARLADAAYNLRLATENLGQVNRSESTFDRIRVPLIKIILKLAVSALLVWFLIRRPI